MRTHRLLDLVQGQFARENKVSDSRKAWASNPAHGEVYVTFEQKGKWSRSTPDQQRVIATIETGGSVHVSFAFSRDGRARNVACDERRLRCRGRWRENINYWQDSTADGSLPMATAVSADGKELYVSTAAQRLITAIHRLLA